MISCVGHEREQMPSLLSSCVCLLALAAADANNWTEANVKRALFDRGHLNVTGSTLFFVPQLTRSHGRVDGCEHMTRSPLGRRPNVLWGGPMLASLLVLG